MFVRWLVGSFVQSFGLLFELSSVPFPSLPSPVSPPPPPPFVSAVRPVMVGFTLVFYILYLNHMVCQHFSFQIFGRDLLKDFRNTIWMRLNMCKDISFQFGRFHCAVLCKSMEYSHIEILCRQIPAIAKVCDSTFLF